MSSGLDVVNIARKEVGYIEGLNNDNKYGQWYGVNHEPYCAMFVSWVFHEAGMSSLVSASTDKGFSYCPSGLSWFQQHGQVVDKYAGQPGDIVFFSWSGHTAEHVGIVVAASKDGITTVEGNTSADHKMGSQANGDGVWLRHRPYLNIIAIVRPKYPTSTKPASSLAQNKKLATGVAGVTALGGGGAAVLNNNSVPATTTATTTISAPPFPGIKAFKPGAPKSNAVKIVEQALLKAGLLPTYLVDGIYTKEDTTAIKIYQKNNGLLEDGIIGPSTYSSLVAKAKI